MKTTLHSISKKEDFFSLQFRIEHKRMIVGASPCNVAVLSMAKFSNIEVVTGLNLPMLVEVLLQRNQLSLPDLAKLAERSGMEGIKSIRNLSL